MLKAAEIIEIIRAAADNNADFLELGEFKVAFKGGRKAQQRVQAASNPILDVLNNAKAMGSFDDEMPTELREQIASIDPFHDVK